MKKNNFCFKALFLGTLLIHSFIYGQTKKVSDLESLTNNQCKLILEKTRNFPKDTQLSIALIEDGIVNFYGLKRVNDSIETINNYKSIFEIGSITKVFTSTLLANLVINNKLKLENNINQYLKLSIKDNQKFTFKELANHTSGLPALPTNLNLMLVNPNNPYKEYKEENLKDYLTNEIKISTTNTDYAYSNLGAGILGFTLSQITNSSYQDLLEEKIFSKYNMTSSTTNRNDIKDNLVKGLDYKGDVVSNWDLGVLSGAGAILSTVEDLSKFAIAQFDNTNKELALTRVKTSSVDKTTDIALGWHIIKNESNNNWIWHNGGTGGYTSSITIDIVNKSGVIVLSNVSAFNPNRKNIDQLCFSLLKTFAKE